MTTHDSSSRGAGRTPTPSTVSAQIPDRDLETSGAETENETQGIVGQATEKAAELVGQATERASDLVDRATEQAKPQLESQKERAVQSLGNAAHALRQTSQNLREQDQGAVAQAADWTAKQIERFSGYLRDRDVDDFTGEVERFARRQPALFLTGAFGLGLLAAGALKNSSQRGRARAPQRPPTPDYTATPAYSPPSAYPPPPAQTPGVTDTAPSGSGFGTSPTSAPATGTSYTTGLAGQTPGAERGTGAELGAGLEEQRPDYVLGRRTGQTPDPAESTFESGPGMRTAQDERLEGR